jgi:AcrR family transcriptional regulator
MARPKLHDETTRELLLRAAGARLAQHGIDAVTVRGVAADAGVTTRAVYALFGSRTELLRAMFTAGFEAFDATLAAVPSTDDALHDLHQLGLAYRQSAIERPYLYEVMFVVDSAQFSPTADDMEVCLRSIQRLHDAVARCVDEGLLAGSVDEITLHSWATVHGLAMLELRNSLGRDPDRIWEASIVALDTGWCPRV